MVVCQIQTIEILMTSVNMVTRFAKIWSILDLYRTLQLCHHLTRVVLHVVLPGEVVAVQDVQKSAALLTGVLTGVITQIILIASKGYFMSIIIFLHAQTKKRKIQRAQNEERREKHQEI